VLDLSDTRLQTLLFCLLLGIYLLVYVNHPTSLDDQAVIAEAASLSEHGRADINAIAHSEWLLPLRYSTMGSTGVDGALYSKKEPLRALAVLPLVALAHAAPWLSIRATAMLFNAPVTAGAAVVLYALVRRQGYQARTAFATSLIYGLATFALVYARTLFGEPLAALLILLGVLAAQRFHEHVRPTWAALTGLAFGLCIGVNNVYALFVPIAALYLFRLHRPNLRDVTAFVLPVVVCLALIGLRNWARFGSPLVGGYDVAEGEGFTNSALTGVYGLLISPFRGVFWYNPILILAIPGWLMLRRKSSGLAWLVLTLGLVQTLAYAAWWSWHGGVVWGPRFLLPITPLLILCIAPLVEAAWTRRDLMIVLAGLVALSVGVQLLGALFDPSVFTNVYLNTHYWTGNARASIPMLADDVLVNPGLSPIVGHLALLKVSWPLLPAWLADGVDGVHFLVSMGVIALGIGLAFWKCSTSVLRVTMATIGILFTVNVVGARQQHGTDYEQVRALDAALQPAGTVVAATTLFDDALIDLENGARVITMNAPTAPDDTLAVSLWDYALRHGNRLWFVTWFGPADPANWQEHQLWQTASFVREQWVADHRALWFDLAPTPAPTHEGGWRFGAIQLDAYGFEVDEDGVRLTLEWSVAEQQDMNYSWFVHLLDADGNIVAQQDRQSQGGYAPTSAWLPGEPVMDYLMFPVSNAEGQIRVGVVDPATGEPLPAFAPDGERLADNFVLLPNRPA
jgi:hypothetical protein